MALHVGLMQNHLGTGPNLVTRVVERRTMSYDRFVELMAMESEMSAEGIRAVITLMRRQLLWALSSGERAVTPLGTFAAHAKGTTVEGEDTPTVRAEGVSVRYRADQEFVSDLRHAIELVNVGEVDRSAPVISCVADFETDGCLETIGAGHMVKITGKRLDFNRAAEDEGLFLIPISAEGDEIASEKIASDLYTRAGTSHIHCRFPAATPPGEYRLRLARRTRNAPSTSPVRFGTYPAIVTVAANGHTPLGAGTNGHGESIAVTPNQE